MNEKPLPENLKEEPSPTEGPAALRAKILDSLAGVLDVGARFKLEEEAVRNHERRTREEIRLRLRWLSELERWEYHQEWDPSALVMGELGQEGWELVSLYLHSGAYTHGSVNELKTAPMFVFKRRLPP